MATTPWKTIGRRREADGNFSVDLAAISWEGRDGVMELEAEATDVPTNAGFTLPEGSASCAHTISCLLAFSTLASRMSTLGLCRVWNPYCRCQLVTRRSSSHCTRLRDGMPAPRREKPWFDPLARLDSPFWFSPTGNQRVSDRDRSHSR